MSKEAMKLALDLATMHHTDEGYDELRSKVRVAAKEALAKQEQGEPKQEDYLSKAYRLANELRCHLAIAPAPQQRTWVGLTDEEIEKCYETTGHYQTLRPQDRFAVFALSHAIEAKLKEKNT